MIQVVNIIVQVLLIDYGNARSKIILPGNISAGSKEHILQMTTCLLYWHVLRSNLLLTKSIMLLLLISKRRLILLI